MRRCAAVVLSVVLLGAPPAAAQSCLEQPLPPAGWLVSIGARNTGELESRDGGGGRPAASALEGAIARDFHGPAAAMLSGRSSDYDLEWLVYDNETGAIDTASVAVANTHLGTRVSFDLFGSVPVCPFIEAGGFRAHLDGGTEVDVSGDYGGFYAGTGWTLQPRWQLDSDFEAGLFVTARLLVIVAGSYSTEGSYETGQELLPKLGFRVGANAAWGALFAGVDAGMIFPGADPDFWLRMNSADDRSAKSVGVHAGVRF